MTVIFQVESVRELEEIQEWLSSKKIIIRRGETDKISASALLRRLSQYRIHLPPNYRFNREEANER